MPSAQCGGFKDVPGGKFLVLRRDGSVPTWTWFVLGAADPYAVPALDAYAKHVALDAQHMGSTKLWCYEDDVRKLASDFHDERKGREATRQKPGDPEVGPHRDDDPLVVALMTGKVTWAQVRAAWEASK